MISQELVGLKEDEVRKLQKQYGLNEFVKKEKPNPIKKFLEVFKEPMFLLLVVTAFLYFILRQPQEAIIMLVFVGFVATITFVQEWRTENALNALKDLTSPHVTVIRNGQKKKIKSDELVPGDIVLLAEGERIPADCSIIETSNFFVDESILTGESEPVQKTSDEDNENEDYWKKNIIYAGTLVTFGKCTAKVESTGFNTEYGKISKAISEAKDELTPLQKKTRVLVRNLAIAGFFLCLMVIILTYFYNHDLIKSILSGITLAMAIIPEEFPVVLTVFLSLGAYRLAKNNTLMRRISAVETLGSATVLAVDKTGTITKNSMEVKRIYSNGRQEDVNEFKSKDLSALMIMACEREPYDPMEKAIIASGKKNIDNIEKIQDYDIAYKIAFDSKTKRMANVYVIDDKYYTAAKGSPETILPLCSLTNDEVRKIEAEVDKMAAKGLRVLALADVETTELHEDLEEYSLNFKGLVGLQDPPKDGVKEAIELCKKAGIRVVMITGDYSKTAVAIGNEIGLKYKDCSITGEQIDHMTDEELIEAVNHCDVFSRVIPEHKMKIIKALKANGEIVAMTGDGVNDAPALKNADIGIAMGKRGTEVAKEAAHMILMDDNFTTIVHSVKDGRRIFDNIRKAMVYIMVIHIPIIAMALFSPLFNLPQILLPVHVVLLELIIDPTCSIIFEGEEAEPNIMNKPPRNPEEPLLTRNMVVKVLLQGATMFAGAFVPFHFMVDSGIAIETARSFSLVSLIFANVMLVLVNRSNTQYLFHIFDEAKNTTRLLINSIALVMAFGIVYIPFLQPLFGTKPLGFGMLLLSLVIGAISTSWWELVKVISNERKSYKRKDNLTDRI